MARQRGGIPVENPKPDLYLILLIISFGAMLLATIIMVVENSMLN